MPSLIPGSSTDAALPCKHFHFFFSNYYNFMQICWMDLSEICILKRPIGRMCLLLFLFLVTCEEATRQLVQVLRVIHFDLGAPPEEILQLSHHRHLRLDPVVEASQLLVQLCPNIWKSEKIKKKSSFILSKLSRLCHFCGNSWNVLPLNINQSEINQWPLNGSTL